MCSLLQEIERLEVDVLFLIQLIFSWTPLFQTSMLTIPELIKNKRDGRVLSDDEISSFIQMVTNKSIQEAQIGAESLGKLFFLYEDSDKIFSCGQEPCSWPSGRRE